MTTVVALFRCVVPNGTGEAVPSGQLIGAAVVVAVGYWLWLAGRSRIATFGAVGSYQKPDCSWLV